MPRRTAGVAAIVGASLMVLGLTLLVGRNGPATVAFSGSHVDVTVVVERSGSQRVVVARFVPDAPGTHLYGPDLPAGGIDGAGRPTVVAIVSGGWAAADGMTTDVEPSPFPTALAGFSAPFSILPAGPVTLRIPIEPAPGDPAVVGVAVSYMACTSDGRCFPPVAGRVVQVPVP